MYQYFLFMNLKEGCTIEETHFKFLFKQVQFTYNINISTSNVCN